ncbi:MAG: translocation/assembly module TamB domain-containing protein [Candidatus Acidiferrales bacterium]
MKPKVRKVIRWFLTVAAVIVVLVVAAGAIIVHTAAFNRFVLAKVIQKADESTGGRLEIQSMTIHWTQLRVDFYNFVLHGTEGSSEPPLLSGERLEVGLKIISLFRRKIGLEEVILDKPVADFRVDSRGHSNLPQPSKAGAPVDVFNLAIRHLALDSGKLYYNDQRIPLSAQLHDFQAQVRFNRLASEYTGRVAYDRGMLAAKTLGPIEHGANLEFSAKRSGFTADPLVITSGRSRISLHAKVTDYSHPDVRGSYDAELYVGELSRVLKDPSLPVGEFTLAGTVQYQSLPGQSFVDSALVEGNLASPALTVKTSAASVDASEIRAEYSLEGGNLHVRSLTANLLGGSLSASFDMRHIENNPASQLDASLRRISLTDVSRAVPSGGVTRPRVVGNINARVRASWASGFQNLMAQSHIVVSAPARVLSRPGDIPLNGLLDINYDGPRDTASLGRSYLQTGNTKVSLSGTLSKKSNLNVQASTTDVQEVQSLASLFRNSGGVQAKGPSSAAYEVHGAAQFNGQILGSLKDPEIQGQLQATNIEVDGTKWRSIHTDVSASSSLLQLSQGSLANDRKGQITFDARASLRYWSFTPTSTISLQAAATNISVASLERLGNIHYPIAGMLSAKIEAHGSEQNPSGHGSVQLSHGSAWNEPVTNLSITFETQGSSIRSNAELQIPAGRVSGNLTFFPQTHMYDASIRTSGLKLDQIQNLKNRNMDISGLLTATASGRGTLREPQLDASLQIPQLQIRGQTISQVKAHLAVAHQHADLTLNSTVNDGFVQAKAGVDLTGQRLATASVDVRALPIGGLLGDYLPGHPSDLQGETEIHATLKGPLANPAQIAAHVEIPTLNLSYDNARLSLVRPLLMDYRDGAITLEQAEMQGTGTRLAATGVIPIKSTAPLNVRVNGTLDLGVLQSAVSGLRSSGRLDLNISAKGDLSRPEMQGQARIENATFFANTIPVSLEGVNGEIQISGNRIEISKLSGAAGGGSVAASGYMIYGEDSSFNLAVQTKSVRIRYPQGLRSVLDSNLTLTGTPSDSVLSGRVLIDRLSFTQQFDLANFMGQFTGESAPAISSPFERNMKLSVSVQSAHGLNLASSKLSLEGAANVNVTGTLANPVILGRASLSGGEIFFLGKRYEVQSGTIEFANPVQTEPIVNLYVSTTVEQYKITLNFIGPIDRLRTNYTSDPPLSPSDIINLIAFGKTATEASTTNTPASLGAESLLASSVGSQVSGKVEKLTGISQITIDPLASNSGQNPGSQVAIQERVTGSLLLTFRTDVTSTQGEAVELQYRFNRRMSVDVLRDQNGGYGVDVRIHKVF